MKLTYFRIRFILILSLFCLKIVHAQESGELWIKQKFESYTDKAVQEKIFLHTDRTFYLPGETIWFKAYVVEGSSMKKLDLSKVAYLEVLDTENQAIIQTKFQLKNGQGNGSVMVPVTAISGMYRLRCYTNWMKNFDSEYFFEAPLKIVNPFVAFDPLPAETSVDNYDIQFFPEGGHLVEGIETKIAFRAIGTDGKGIGFSGKITNQQGDLITEFAPEKHGMGYFYLKPLPGEKYTAVIRDMQRKSSTYPMPEVTGNGYALMIADTMGRQIQGAIERKNMPEEKLWLVAHTRQKSLQIHPVNLINNKAVCELDKSKFGEGISHITLMNDKGLAYCERLYFTFSKKVLLPTVSTNKSIFLKREKIVIDIGTTVAGKIIQDADMSVSVFLDDGLSGPEFADISSYLWLTSDLKGKIESPETYFDKSNSKAQEEIDMLMLTHGWRRLRWDRVIADQQHNAHLPEIFGHFIYSKVSDLRTGKPANNQQIFMASPDSPVRLYMAQTDEEGMARFEVKDFYGPKELTFQPDLSIDSTLQFELLSPFVSSTVSDRKWGKFSFDTSKEELLLNHAINMQTVNAFIPKPYLSGKISLKDTMAFFGPPDELYYLDDYTRFPTMEEVLREYVRGVFVRKRQGTFYLRMVDKLIPNTYYETNPLVLLDGIPVFDINKLMAFDALKIKKIELLKGRYILGQYSATGIASFTTYYNDLGGYELAPQVHVQAYDGIQPTREFYSPKYDQPAEMATRIPDFRNLLYWAPDVKTDLQGKAGLHFYSSDQTGTYKVVVQGITADGTAGSQSYTFEVKNEDM